VETRKDSRAESRGAFGNRRYEELSEVYVRLVDCLLDDGGPSLLVVVVKIVAKGPLLGKSQIIQHGRLSRSISDHLHVLGEGYDAHASVWVILSHVFDLLHYHLLQAVEPR